MIHIGWKIIHYQSVTSTNDLVKSLAENFDAEGVIVMADEQSQGRGQRLHTWISPSGKGLYCSLLIKPRLNPENCGLLALYSAVAVARSIRNVAGVQPRLKWPNDILLNDKKVAGVLIETTISGRQLKHAVIGVGINLAHVDEDFPQDVRCSATSLLLYTGQMIAADRLLETMTAEFNALYPCLSQDQGRSAKLIQEWLENCSHLNKPVVISVDSSSIHGIFCGVNENGQALVMTGDKMVMVQNIEKFQ